MSTIINNPGSQNTDSGSGVGLLLGIIVVIAAGMLFYFYGLPMMSGQPNPADTNETTNIDVQIPAPEITVPGGDAGSTD